MQYVDVSSDAQLHAGHLYCYQETPGIRLLVRLVSHTEEDDLLWLTLDVLAIRQREGRPAREVAQQLTVSTQRTGGWNQIWMLYQLQSNTLDGALAELRNKRRQTRRYSWVPVG